MWARSHTSGLMISMCWVSRSESLNAATIAMVRSRASARASVTGDDERIALRLQKCPYGLVTCLALRQTPTTSRTDAVRHEIRESSGRTASSKRPDSSCSSSVTSAWKRRPFLSTSTMSPAAILFEVVRRGGSSPGTSMRLVCSTPGTLRTGPDGPGDLVPDGAVERDVGLAVGVRGDDARALGGQGAAECGAEALDVLGDLVAAPEQCRRMREVEPVRGRDVLDEVRSLLADRQEVEDPAAVVVEQHDRELAPRGLDEAAEVVDQRHVADEEHDRAVCDGGDPEGGRDGPVDAVGAAVGEHARRPLARREERLDVAHRHRRCHDDGGLGRERGAELGGHARL